MPEKPFIFALSTCSHCKRAKQFLTENNVAFDFIDVDLQTGQQRTDVIEEVKKHNPRTTFPTILIGGTVIIGFKEDEIRQALGMS